MQTLLMCTRPFLQPRLTCRVLQWGEICYERGLKFPGLVFLNSTVNPTPEINGTF